MTEASPERMMRRQHVLVRRPKSSAFLSGVVLKSTNNLLYINTTLRPLLFLPILVVSIKMGLQKIKEVSRSPDLLESSVCKIDHTLRLNDRRG